MSNAVPIMAHISTADPSSSRRPSVSQPASRRHPRSRSQSISSDRPSTIMSHGLASPPMTVSPEAAFIAPSAASQIVTNDHDSHADTWYDQHGIEPSGQTVLVSPSALQLVNDFLDQLLFSFLQISRSTTLAALRPAVSEVLKPKLAKDVINNADEELREYLGGADEEDFLSTDASQAERDWDPELVWKRTRLRCMVYSSLGDMEEEDEDYYTEHENLEPGVDERRSDAISPAVAIFLTSILEYMGEAALVVAGQAACHRMQTAFEKDLRDGVKTNADVADRIVVEDFDMERVALDRTLGRLWRGWKKRIRCPAPDTPRSFSRASFSTHGRQKSFVGETPWSAKKLPDAEEKAEAEPPTESKDVKGEEGPAAVNSRVEDYVKASAIPLPVGQRDVDEIEVPGLVSYSDDEEDANGEDKTIQERKIRRPKSLMVFSPRLAVELPPSPAVSRPGPPLGPIPSARKRSVSLPAPSQFLYAPPLAKRPKFESTSSEAPEQRESAADAEKNEDITLPQKAGDDSKRAADTPGESKAAGKSGEQEQNDRAPEIRRRSSKRLSRYAIGATLAGATATTSTTNNGATANRKPEMATEDGAGTPAAEAQKEAEESSDSEIEEFDEEPQILTSARISYAGRTSPAVSISSKGSSVNINTNLPRRTPSVHSARVIDVIGPKSPLHSRPPSTERDERARQVGVDPPPTVEEKAGPAGSVPVPRPAGDRITPKTGTSLSISASGDEVEGPAAPPSPMYHAQGIAELPAQPIYGTVVRQPASTRHENGPAITATLWNTSNPSARTANSSPTSSPAKAQQQQQQQTTHASGASPRNLTSLSTAKHGQSPSIGMISVERHSPSTESPERTRQVYTSGSSASSGTGKLRPVRTSEESKNSHRGDHLARHFDELIQSDQTIQYTLTPEHMRNMTSAPPLHNSAVLPTRQKGVDDVRTTSNGDWSRFEANATTRKPSLPIPEMKPTSAPAAGYVPKAPVSTSSKKSKPGGIQPRDARVPRESVNDFADFIRSTGPAVDYSPAPLPLVNAEQARSIKQNTDLRRLASLNKNRPRLQARDAAVDSREDNSDLIDFIRRGPPGAQNHRIPRNVAPFRSTMDSDQMAGAVGGRAVDATLPDTRNSQASTSVTDTTMTSAQSSSINSQSALLRNDRQTGVIEEEDFMPKRTRPRIRDPYAIDLTDEEDEDDLDLAVKPPPKREESLAEFLRNYEPPPSEPAPTHMVAAPKKPKKKASAPSLMGRFSRSFQGSSQTSANHGPAGPLATGTASRNGSRTYIPIQVTMTGANDNKYAPVDKVPTTASQPPSTRSSGRVLMKKYEPREATSSVTRTSDLADFLRDSEPPPQIPTSMSAYSRDDDAPSSSSFSKMFSRRKKSAAFS
ncbi:hypothetical protein SODALDRAFT_112353 [Sodiomyces alkalinus F11]|uniref:Flo11 n=1 Tax=Sodiomyces alkalinus (strain CBS 110278 / VKM F-3762 / F11) TaxID=1314773 RepID=A0A3N2Q2X6_SODAK|nr:hypothetical protein SODALDRAFT_112353 [Sodiomyces alkalinus F11]ROT41121.1 hypothetical protein SODALDRAFT_112353 [Sodiomyces alkalinus F11]